MWNRLEKLLRAQARWPVMLALFLACAFILGVLFPLASPTERRADVAALDTQLWYSRADVAAHMDALTPPERRAAARSHLTVDLLFPLTYGTLLAMLLLKTQPESRLWLLAPAAVLADVAENLLLSILYLIYPSGLGLAPLAALVTALKWTVIALIFFYIIRGAFERWTARTLERLKKEAQ